MAKSILLSFNVDCLLTSKELDKLKTAISETLADMEFYVPSEKIKCFEER